MRGCEVQDGKRGGTERMGLHDHVLVRTRSMALEERVVRRLAIRAGFGHSVALVECAPGSKREAYYVSKYITKSTDQRGIVPWRELVVDVETGEVTEQLAARARFRTWSASREWGVTMAQIRAEAVQYMLARETEPERDCESLRARRRREWSEQIAAVAGVFGPD